MDLSQLKLKDLIRTLRLEKGWSQRRLALYTEISNTEISRIENGTRQKPDPEILEKIAKSLGVDYNLLAKSSGYLLQKVDLADVLKEEELTYKGEILSAGQRQRIKQALDKINVVAAHNEGELEVDENLVNTIEEAIRRAEARKRKK